MNEIFKKNKEMKQSKWNNLYRLPILLVGLLVVAFIVTSCSDDDEEDLLGNWIVRSDFEGDQRSSGVSFVIGDYAYVGTGFNGSDDEYYNDFWRYDLQLNYWQKIADFPGAARSSAVAFSIDGKGFVGTGYDGDDELNDFYEYDPATLQWTEKAEFGGSARRNAVGFSLEGYGYIGTGYDGSELKDFWQYNPSNDTWAAIPSLGGAKRKDATAFVIGSTAYVCTGIHNGSYEYDVWALEADLIGTEEFPWVEMQPLDEDDDYSIVRSGAVGFSMNNRGYVALGTSGSVTGTVWEYVPGSDTWIERTEFEGYSRTDAVGFTIGERGFMATGRNGSSYYDDLYEFRPLEEYDEDD
jgi:N-acetylneuraminic acid mutarotase